MLDKLALTFAATYGHNAKQIVRAPGRVNLIGEHTDYNEGFVLPCAIEYHTLVAVSPRDDNAVHTLALDCDGETDQFFLDQPIEFFKEKMWANYVRGVASEMLARGLAITGCNFAITGDVPQGAGLSSSAALEVAVGRAFASNANIRLSGLELAKIGQDAENNFVGCNCGIMDQLVSACGQAGHALGIDCRDYTFLQVPVPDDLAIVMINTNVKRGLIDSEYNTRRQQCEAAAQYFSVPALRDVSLDLFNRERHALPPLLAKRAQHILEENERTLQAYEALEAYDLPRLSQLMAASHRSMKDLFEITTPEVDFLVDAISHVLGDQAGVRMTGGGFGGCVVVLAPGARVNDVIQTVKNCYFAETGIKETIYLTKPCAGESRIG